MGSVAMPSLCRLQIPLERLFHVNGNTLSLAVAKPDRILGVQYALFRRFEREFEALLGIFRNPSSEPVALAQKIFGRGYHRAWLLA